MTMFRPCIDLHQGKVKQIVGGSLTDQGARENFVSEQGAEWFARRYRDDGLAGGHVIQLGPGNEEAACAALAAYPHGLQIGGGMDLGNAARWLERGASHIIVTSHLFDQGEFSFSRLEALSSEIGVERLVVDLSCRRTDDGYFVATNRWQTVTSTQLSSTLLNQLAPYCAEYLIHAADVEGLCRGIDAEVLLLLAESPRPCTYAGGARSIDDLQQVKALSGGRVDLTYGSALDLFGGQLVRYEDCVRFNREEASSHSVEGIVS